MAISRITHALNQTGSLSSASAQDKFGKASYGSATSVACRAEKVTKNVVTKQNELTPIHLFVMLDSDASPAVDDKFTFGGVDYKIKTVEAGVNRLGETTHWEANCQEWNL